MSELENPEYRNVVSFPGYRVGDDGSLWSRWKNGGNDRTGQVLTDRWRRLKGWVDKRRGKNTGYIKVGLMKDGVLYRLRLHRLILEAFIGPCPKGMQGRHLDDNKENLRLSNLAWGTPHDNAEDRQRNGIYPRGENHPRAKLKKADISIIKASPKSGHQLAREYGVSPATINAARRGDSWR